MNQEDTFDITIVPPDNSLSVPIYFETGHRVPDGYYSPAGSSAGSSTPETPYKPLLDLSVVNVNLQAGVNTPNFFERPQHQGFSSEGASSFSHGGLSPVTQSFGGLSLADGIPSFVDYGARASSVRYEDSSQIFGEMPRRPTIHPSSESPCPSPARQSLSPLIIPQQLQASQNAGDPSGYFSEDDFIRSIFNFGDERPASSIDSRTPLSASHSEPSSLHPSWGSPSPSSTTDLPHPLVFNTAEHEVFRVQSIDGGLAQRRNTHSGGRSGFMNAPGPDRGRQDERAPPSPSSSRRSSPYPSHHHHTPGLSSSSLSPHSAIDSSHLSVPDREFFCGLLPGDAVRRRHSFTQTGRLAETPFLHSSETNPSLSSTSAERPIRKVASQAGIKASEARRTKEARFACVWCNQTFTTNHNLKNHVNVHLGLKDHSCTRCRRDFTTQSVLQRHLKTCKAPELF